MDVADQRRLELYGTLFEAKRVLPLLLTDPRKWHAFQTTTFEPFITRALCRYANGGLLLHFLSRGNNEPDAHGHPRDIAVELYEGLYAMTRGTVVDGVPGIQGEAEIISAGMRYTLLTSESHTIEVLSDRVLSICYVGEKSLDAISQDQTTPLTRERKLAHLDLFRPYC